MTKKKTEIQNEDGTVRALAVFAADITGQKAIEHNFSDTRHLLRIILGTISDAVFIIDGKGFFRFVGSSVDAIFGYTREQVLKKKNIHSLIPDMSLDASEFFPDGRITNREYAVKNKTGQQLVIYVNMKRIDYHGSTILITCRDITEQKKVQDELLRKNIALAELFSAVEQEKSNIAQTIDSRLRRVVFPIVSMVAERPGCSDLATLLKSSLTYATSVSRNNGLSLLDFNLSPRELQLCDLITGGMNIKQIARTLNTSPLTIEKQRKSIRRKLGIADGKTNLSTYLARLHS